MKSFLAKLSPAATALAAAAFLALPLRAQAEVTLENAMIPGADLVTRIQLEELRNSPIGKSLKQKETPETKAKSEAMWKSLGVKEEDIRTLFFSMDLDEAENTPAGTKADPRFLLGVESAAAWDLKALAKTIQEQAEEKKKDGPATIIEEVTIAGVPALKISEAKEDEAPQENAGAGQAKGKKGKRKPIVAKNGEIVFHQLARQSYMAAEPGGKILLVSVNEADLAKALGGANEAATPELAAFIQAKPGMAISGGLLLTEAMKQKLQAKQDKKAQNQGFNPFAAVQKSFSTMEKASWSLEAGEDLRIRLGFGLASLQEAAEGSTALDGMLQFFRTMLAMQQQPANPDPQTALINNLLKGVKVGKQEKDVTVGLTVSRQMAEQFQEEIQKQVANQVQALAPPMEEELPPAKKGGNRPKPVPAKDVDMEPAA